MKREHDWLSVVNLLVWPFLLAALLVPAVAGAQVPADSALSALADRLVAGDESVRDRLAPLAREVRERALAVGTSSALFTLSARVHDALASPLSPPEATAWSARESLWRPGLVEALRLILAVDSTNVRALTALHRLAPYPLLWHSPARELAHFRAVVRAADSLPPDIASAWVALELEAGDPQSASVSLQRVRHIVSDAAAHHLGAQIAFARGADAEGVRQYKRATTLITSERDAALFVRDVKWIATDSIVTSYASIALSERTLWLQRFWAGLDASDARPSGARLVEHFRRWRLSLTRYRWSPDGWAAGHPPFVEVPDAKKLPPGLRYVQSSGLRYLVSGSPKSQVLDDRGSMVMRHGDPIETVQPGSLAADFATLGWDTENGLVLLGFGRPDLPGDLGIAARLGMLVRGFPQGDLMTNCQLDSGLCVLAAAESQEGRQGLWGLGAIRGEQMFAKFTTARTRAERTSGNPILLSRRIPVVAQAYGISADHILVVVSVPWQQLADGTSPSDPGTLLLRVRMSLANGAGESVSVDTVRRLQLRSAPEPGAYVSMMFEVPVTPGTWMVGIVASDTATSIGGGARVRSVHALNLGAPQLQVSDPILGRPASGLSWTFNGTTIPLNPAGAWRRQELSTLHYRVGGMRPGDQYRTTIELWESVPTAAAPRLQLSTTSVARNAEEAFDREIDISRLRNGAYRVVVRVIGTDGSSASAEQGMVVR